MGKYYSATVLIGENNEIFEVCTREVVKTTLSDGSIIIGTLGGLDYDMTELVIETSLIGEIEVHIDEIELMEKMVG